MKLLVRVFLVFLVCMLFMPTNRSEVYSLENCTEAKLRDLGVAVVNCSGSNTCEAPTANTGAGVLANGSSVYILGDSITFLSTDKIEPLFAEQPAPYRISKINADSGRAITYDSGGGDPTGLEAVATDASIIAGSQAVVIALGTNSGNEDLSVEIPNLLAKVRGTGFSGQIYWVNLFYTKGEGPSVRNATILGQSDDQSNYVVIDTINAGVELGPDQVHPTEAGESTFAKTILNGLKTLPTTSEMVQPEVSGQCACSVSGAIGTLNNTVTWGEGVWGTGSEIYQSGLTGPYTVEQWAIHVLKNIAKKSGVAESTLVTKSKVVSLVAWAKAEGGGVDGHNGTFNPLNTKGGSGELGGVNQGNASTDSNSNGFPTFDKGVEGITRGLFNQYQKRIGSALLQPNISGEDFIEAVAGDFYSSDGTQAGVVNRLESIYPGDKLWAAMSATGLIYSPNTNPKGIGDRAKYVAVKRSTLESVRTNYEAYAGKILDGSPPGTPAPLVFSSGGSIESISGSACVQPGQGSVNTDGYSFPLEPQTKAVGGITVNQTTATHHDGTPAFDLFSTDSADVYAIFSGTPVNINRELKGVVGCSSIQFKADDGYYYWYGHLKNVTVQEGIHLEAGVKMAEIADASFGSTCVGGGPHLHIDRGCVIDNKPQFGGKDECRDPEFIPFLSKLFESLPD